MECLRSKVRVLEDQNTALAMDIQHLYDKVVRLNFTPTVDLEVGKRVIEFAKIKLYDQILPITAMSTLVSLDFEDGELTRECQSEQDTQQKFATFFKKLPPGKWSIRDTSSSGFFNEPTAKIDFSIMDGQTVAWPHLVAPIEIRHDLAKHHGFRYR